MFDDIKLGEAVVGSIVKNIGLDKFSTILNNVFSHGTILVDYYGSCSNNELELVFEGIEKFKQSAKLIEG